MFITFIVIRIALFLKDFQETKLKFGIDVDSALNFDAHINSIIGKAYCRIGVLYKGFTSRNIVVLKRAYIAYVRPILEYASSVWSPHLLKHIDAIERVQKHFTKRIPSLAHLSYSERLAIIDLEPLELRRLKADLILYFKCFHNLVALSHEEYFLVSQHFSQTRTGGNRLIIPLCRTNCFQNDFFNRRITCWNSLPSNVIDATSIVRFKQLLCTVDLRAFYLVVIFKLGLALAKF